MSDGNGGPGDGSNGGSEAAGDALDAVERGPEASAGADAGAAVASDPAEADHPTVRALAERFGDAVTHHEVAAGDEHVVFLDRDRAYDILKWLKEDEDQGYDLLRDVTGVDYGGGRPLQVVYVLFSIRTRRALRVKVELPLSDLEVPSVVTLWQAANWLEREVYDLFGIEFEGHPDLRRILMPENYAEGHPLRKDFPLRGRFSRAEQTRRALSQDPHDHYIPDELEIGREFQRAEGAPDTRPDLPEESRDTPGGVDPIDERE